MALDVDLVAASTIQLAADTLHHIGASSSSLHRSSVPELNVLHSKLVGTMQQLEQSRVRAVHASMSVLGSVCNMVGPIMWTAHVPLATCDAQSQVLHHRIMLSAMQRECARLHQGHKQVYVCSAAAQHYTLTAVRWETVHHSLHLILVLYG
jgi:hypothetical protein